MPFHAIGQRLCRCFNSAQCRNLRHALTPNARQPRAQPEAQRRQQHLRASVEPKRMTIISPINRTLVKTPKSQLRLGYNLGLAGTSSHLCFAGFRNASMLKNEARNLCSFLTVSVRFGSVVLRFSATLVAVQDAKSSFAPTLIAECIYKIAMQIFAS